MSLSPESSETLQPRPSGGDSTAPQERAHLADVAALAESLDAKDRVRLIGRLLESLPPKHRAAIMEFGRKTAQASIPSVSPPTRVDLPRAKAPSPTVWEWLFDPSKTSGLYSAPRRFDLATIFVVTAAYSILFGVMSSLTYYFGPVTEVAVGTLVTIVAVVQAFYKDIANPRGVSLVTGAIAQTIIVVLIKLASPQLIPEPLVFVAIFYGILGGLFTGYLAGVLVGGVFLVADMLRTKLEGRSKTELNGESADEVD